MKKSHAKTIRKYKRHQEVGGMQLFFGEPIFDFYPEDDSDF